MAAAPKPEKAPTYVPRVKMSRRVALGLRGKDRVELRVAEWFPTGDRVFLVEWDGGPTGRADLCRVVSRDKERVVIERRYCWHNEAPDDLLDLGLRVATNVEYPMLRATALGEQES